MSDERRKKSWKEIDRNKDRSKHTGRRTVDNPMGPRAKRAVKLGYSSYKSSLDKLFDEGVMTDGLKKTLGRHADAATGAKATDGSRTDLLRKMKKASDFKKFLDLVAKYRKAGFSYPDDFELLIRLLDHPDEDVLLEVLEALEGALQRKACKRVGVIRQRLDILEDIVSDEALDVMDRIRDYL